MSLNKDYIVKIDSGEYTVTVTDEGEYVVNVGQFVSGVGYSNVGTGQAVLDETSPANDIKFRTIAVDTTLGKNNLEISLVDGETIRLGTKEDMVVDDLSLTGNLTVLGAGTTVSSRDITNTANISTGNLQVSGSTVTQNITLNGTLGGNGDINIAGDITAPNMNFSGTLTGNDFDDVVTIDGQTNQNMTITVDGGYYLHANVSDLYAGSLTQAAHITGTEIKHVGERLDITGELYGAVEFDAKNTEGTEITRGTAVYIKGHSGNNPEIGVASANTPAKMPAFGIAAEAIGNNNRGDIVTFGELRGFDTSAFAVGDELYVGNTGALQNTKPTGTDQAVQKVAKVIRSHTENGILFVMGAGRTNDVPNTFSQDIIPTGTIDLGSSTNTFNDAHIDNLKVGVVAPPVGQTSITLNGNLVPQANVTYSLGSSSAMWSDVYVGPGSLYIDGQKVLGSDETGAIDITTDDDQNLNISAGGAGTGGEVTIFSAGSVTTLQDDTVNLGPTGATATINARGTLEAPDLHVGDLELSATLINQTTTNQNLEIRTNGTGYLHANVADFYVGPLSGAVKIDENSISATAGTLQVTGQISDISNHSIFDLSDVSGDAGAGKLLVGTGSGLMAMSMTSDNIAEGSTNLFFTDARAVSAIENATALDITGDFTVEGSNAKKTVIGDSLIAGSFDTHGFKVFADDTAWGSVTIQEYVGGANKPAASGFANPTFGTEMIGGTPTAKSNVVSGKRLFNLQALASNATDGSLPSTSNFLMKVETTEDQTASARGTKLAIETMANGSTSRATTLVLQDDTITVNPDGDGKIESGGTLILNDAVNVTGTLDAQSTIINSTGNVQVNDNLDVTGNLTVSGTVSLGDANTDAITVNGPMTCVNGLVLTSLDTATANYLAGVLGIIDEGAIAYITDGDGGNKCIAVYDGSNWKRISFGANISSS